MQLKNIPTPHTNFHARLVLEGPTPRWCVDAPIAKVLEQKLELARDALAAIASSKTIQYLSKELHEKLTEVLEQTKP